MLTFAQGQTRSSQPESANLVSTTIAPSARSTGLDLSSSSGQPLDSTTRAIFETRFAHDFSRVRVHTDAKAAEAAQTASASAFTLGRHIVFNAGQYSPGSVEGRRVLAHELTHVVQQQNADINENTPLRFGDADSSFEIEAEQNSHQITATSLTNPHSIKQLMSNVPAGTVQRQFVTPHTAGGGFAGLIRRGQPSGGATQSPASSLSSTLHFYHGTRWSVAQNMNRIEHRGTGDFGVAFYTHFEPNNNEAALNRAKARGDEAASQPPTEPHIGVLEFLVPSSSFAHLLNVRSRVFPFYNLDQPDNAVRQREWLNYITARGRTPNPQFFVDRHGVGRWRHHEFPPPNIRPEPGDNQLPPPYSAYNLAIGPFYTSVIGSRDQQPPRSAFRPRPLDPAAPTQLQQQVVWAGEALNVLNSVPRNVMQFERNTHRQVVPPIPRSMPPPPVSDYYTPQTPSEE
jgi:hypothetical protein